MKKHKFKIKKQYAYDILKNGKNFEVRKNDRDYKVGDILIFYTFEDDNPTYILAKIGYILNDKEYCKYDYVILGLKNIHKMYYVDDNGNVWTEDEYTVEEAKEMSETFN